MTSSLLHSPFCCSSATFKSHSIHDVIPFRRRRCCVAEASFRRDELKCQQKGDDDDFGSTTLFGLLPFIYPEIAEGTGYSQASYYTSLGLFVLSVPGLWSLIKRSAKSKVVRKTFEVPGPKEENGKAPNQIAGEILSFFTRNSFQIVDRGETITFEGKMVPSRGQAAFLTFCTLLSLGSVALVLSITVPDIGEKWYWIMVLSPLAGVYYWRRASRKEQIKVKMVVADDESSTDVLVQGDDEQVESLRKELRLMEKGMVYVKGLFEN